MPRLRFHTVFQRSILPRGFHIGRQRRREIEEDVQRQRVHEPLVTDLAQGPPPAPSSREDPPR